MDILENLKSLQFENGISEEDRSWLYLRGRSRGLMVEACAHAVFFCKLVRNLRELIQETPDSRSLSGDSVDLEAADDEKLKVGIIGGGHLGKQLTRALLQLGPVPAESLRISTRRPESLGSGHTQVVLPIVQVCYTRRHCAMCLVGLKQLLNTTNILRPQYQCAEDLDNIWGANKEITAALQDPVILRATCPYSPAGGITLNIKWLEGVCYACLNICTASNMAHSQGLQLLNKVFLSVHYEGCKTDEAPCPKFQLTDFVNTDYVKNMFHNRPFPWFDLTVVQLKETPFSQLLSSSTVLQDHLTHLYCDSFGVSLVNKDQPVVSMDSPSQ